MGTQGKHCSMVFWKGLGSKWEGADVSMCPCGCGGVVGVNVQASDELTWNEPIAEQNSLWHQKRKKCTQVPAPGEPRDLETTGGNGQGLL